MTSGLAIVGIVGPASCSMKGANIVLGKSSLKAPACIVLDTDF
jgi:hypothetical protein